MTEELQINVSGLQELADEAARKVVATAFGDKEWDRTRRTRIVLEYMKKAVAESEDRYDGAVRSIIKLERDLKKVATAKVEDLADSKAVILAAHKRLMFPNVTMKIVQNDPIVYAINNMVYAGSENRIAKLEGELVEAREDTERLEQIFRWGYVSFSKGSPGTYLKTSSNLRKKSIYASTHREAIDAARAKEAGDGKD